MKDIIGSQSDSQLCICEKNTEIIHQTIQTTD